MRAPILHSSHLSRIFHDTHPSPLVATPNPLTAAHSSPLLLSSLSSFIPPSICPPIGALFHPSPVPFHPSPALWSLIISSLHKSNLTSLLPPIRPFFLHLFRPSPHTRKRVSEEHVTSEVGARWAFPCSATIRWFACTGLILILL